MRGLFVWCFAVLFFIDATVRMHLMSAYDAAPDSTMVVGAVANTTGDEIESYFSTHWRNIAGLSLVTTIAAALAFKPAMTGQRVRKAPSKFALTIFLAAILLSVAAYASKPWRRMNPVIFWTNFSESVQSTKRSWITYGEKRAEAEAKALEKLPIIQRPGSSTIVLVISESINRENMSVYGYPRKTTPQLENLYQSQGENIGAIRNAWSTEATTVPSLNSMLNFNEAQGNQLNLLALAKAAGYKTWWISNHNDLAIEQQHAAFADHTVMQNNKPGRSSSSLDEVLMPAYEQALQDSSSNKFIILHMLGAHPHYRLRFSEEQRSFENDQVTKIMTTSNKPGWVQKFRNEYDSAIFYQDQIVASVFNKALISQRSSKNFSAVVYTSDHGQEVGHLTNKVGHSPNTISGYKIPMIIWSSNKSYLSNIDFSARPFRSDWLSWTMADLLDLRWNTRDFSRSVLASNYVWEEPKLPITVNSFIE